MADNHSKEVRSKNMSHIKSTNTKPEEIVRKYLFSHGLRYRKNVRTLPGCRACARDNRYSPSFRSIFLPLSASASFFSCNSLPFESKKINKNVERDAENHRILSEQGWKVLVIWECQLKKKVADENLENLYNAITQ